MELDGLPGSLPLALGLRPESALENPELRASSGDRFMPGDLRVLAYQARRGHAPGLTGPGSGRWFWPVSNDNLLICPMGCRVKLSLRTELHWPRVSARGGDALGHLPNPIHCGH
jgi:hypothetical protein